VDPRRRDVRPGRGAGREGPRRSRAGRRAPPPPLLRAASAQVHGQRGIRRCLREAAPRALRGPRGRPPGEPHPVRRGFGGGWHPTVGSRARGGDPGLGRRRPERDADGCARGRPRTDPGAVTRRGRARSRREGGRRAPRAHACSASSSSDRRRARRRSRSALPRIPGRAAAARDRGAGAGHGGSAGLSRVATRRSRGGLPSARVASPSGARSSRLA
jgi:hypothetical protein